MANDPYTDDEYDDTYRDVHGDEPVRDQYTDERADDSFFPSARGSSLYPSGWGIWPGGETVDADYDRTETNRAAYDEGVRAEDEEDDSWWDEGLIGLLLVAGVILFLFPEPATSAVGIGLVVVGVIAWAIDALT